MSPELRLLLMSVDDPEGCECPTNSAISFEEMDEMVDRVQRDIAKEFGITMQRDRWVQDASFFDDLFLNIGCTKSIGGQICKLRIRFSNFGNLVAMTSFIEPFPPDIPRSGILALLRRNGCIPVDADELDEEYDGVNPHLADGRSTWWIRYFDYL
jgi:hypothetical protein